MPPAEALENPSVTTSTAPTSNAVPLPGNVDAVRPQTTPGSMELLRSRPGVRRTARSHRRRIIEAALDLARQRGDHRSFTMRELARRLSMSPTALYQYFEAKSQIEAAVRDQVLSELREELRAGHDDADPWLAIAGWLEGFSWRGCHDPVRRACLDDLEVDKPDADNASLVGAAELIGVLQSAESAGRLRDGLTPELALRLIWTFANGLLRLCPKQSNGHDGPADDAVESSRAIRVFVDGILASDRASVGDGVWRRRTS